MPHTDPSHSLKLPSWTETIDWVVLVLVATAVGLQTVGIRGIYLPQFKWQP